MRKNNEFSSYLFNVITLICQTVVRHILFAFTLAEQVA